MCQMLDPTQYIIVIGYAMITHLRASEKQAKKTSCSHDQIHDLREPSRAQVASTAGVQAADVSSIPRSYSCLSPRLDPNKFRLPLTRGVTKRMRRARRLRCHVWTR
jgi:hypothetical protein